MNGTIVVPDVPELPERDPDCELCQHHWFSAHLHTDGSGRCVSRDMRTVYVQQMVEDVPTCSCPNGQHTEPGKRPKCWHVDGYLRLKDERRLLGQAMAAPGSRVKLEDLF